MIHSSVYYKQLEKRLDAEFYRPQYLQLKNYLLSIEAKPLGKLIDGIYEGRITPKLGDYCEEGYPYIRAQNIQFDIIDLTDVPRIRADIHKAIPKAHARSGDILLTIDGVLLGKSAVVPKELGECSITNHCVRIVVKKQFNPYYISIILNSKIGQLQIKRSISGSAQPGLRIDIIKEILVPIVSSKFQKKIEDLVITAYEKRKLADQKYKQAKQLLNKKLGISKLELEEEKTFEAKFSEIKQVMRFDSEYYKPKYKKIIDFLENSDYEVKKLREVVKILSEKIDPTKEPTKKFRYVPIAKINSDGEIDEWKEFKGWQAPSRARMIIKKGDVLVSSLGGSIDKIALVPEELDNSIATTGTFVIRSENYYSEFLFLLFRTPLIKLQLEQKTAGAIMAAVPKTTFGDLLIPLLPKSKQEEISKLVRESFKLRKESKKLLERAKKEVEKMIENSTNHPLTSPQKNS